MEYVRNRVTGLTNGRSLLAATKATLDDVVNAINSIVDIVNGTEKAPVEEAPVEEAPTDPVVE